MSSSAPVDTRLHATISAARPPMSVTRRPRSSSANINLRSSSPGGMYVKPSAPPLRATIDSTSGRCWPGIRDPTAVPTTACPASCADTTSFSAGPSSERFFSIPATVRSTADSNCSLPTTLSPLRPASSAASFTRLAKSAPVKPAVMVAMSSISIPGCMGKLRDPMWTPRISLRPCLSGRSTDTVRSKRPGRFSAESRVSARLVAARQITSEPESKPSSSVSSWFSVCSRSSFPIPRIFPSLRPLATASISSMNTIDGACSRARAKTSRTRAAPIPTYSSTNSEALTLMNGTPASPATARANSVFPVPGAPTKRTPLGGLAPRRV
mmetsp:Transcript_17754/g.43970  ORF Transcript_17754/g.43970 Transcript_17754/m.43970 type:complete len:325 (+) Transcript_17754:741-1715(+)